jgi:hypothetical protein
MMEHEQINDRCVALSTRGSKITARILAKAMLAIISKAKKPRGKNGEQSLKSLSKSGSNLEDIEISGENIGSFKKIARKYDIDFALKCDKSESPPKWVAFFKSKDGKAMEKAFNEYASQILKQKSKGESLADKLSKSKERVKESPDKVLERVKDLADMAR